MKRRLLNLLTVLSLLLCFAVIVLWVRSFWLQSAIMRNSVVVTAPHSLRTQWFVSASGRVGWADLHLWTSAEAAAEAAHQSGGRPRYQFREKPLLPTSRWTWGYRRVVETKRKATREGLQLFGFCFEAFNDADPRLSERQLDVWIPYWFVASALATPAATRMALHWRRRWCRSANLCPSCGYDLRATPGRCPECGSEYPAGISN